MLIIRRGPCYTRTKRLETQLADAESECARLLRTLEQSKSERERVESDLVKRREEVERELTTTKTELETARGKVKSVADYDEIKRELEIMKVSAARLKTYAPVHVT